jgi:glycosyltransferase involved in cell wall biosynthesis
MITTSWLQNVPGIFKYYRYFLPLFPFIIESMRIPEADLLISTSHCVAKGLRQKPGCRHLCYCFTPMRYAWTFYSEYFGNNVLKAIIAKPLLAAMRKWDRNSSDRVDRFVAISRHVRKRIADFYERDADVVYPPVDTEKWTPGAQRDGKFDLIVSALVPYKRIDLAINAYNRLGFPLKIVGVGTDLRKMRASSSANIEFLEWQSDEKLLELYRNCRLLVFAGEEDFGIVPLEAQACGTPVVAFARGGLLETIQDGKTGIFFNEQTVESLNSAVTRAAAANWDRRVVRANAEKFDTRNFIDGLASSIDKCLHL